MKWTRSNIIDILENHDVEMSTLERQIVLMGDMLEADLEEIRHRVYPGAVVYDRDRVQTTPTPNDERIVNVVMSCDERRDQHKRDVAEILERIRDIRQVYSAIQRMDALEKSILLNVYYPRRSLEEASELMKMSPRTVSRKRDEAIGRLQKTLENQKFVPDLSGYVLL